MSEQVRLEYSTERARELMRALDEASAEVMLLAQSALEAGEKQKQERFSILAGNLTQLRFDLLTASRE